MSDRTVGIVDYGMGNLLSVHNALEMIGAKVTICPRPEDLSGAERIILPGVGAFKDCIGNLSDRGFVPALNREVLEKRKPILGICLGMQVMAGRGFEMGEFAGLGWFDADVVRLTPADPSLKIPQIGWNEIDYRRDKPLFKGLPETVAVYFVHSYFMKCRDGHDVVATCDYGGPVTAAVNKGNIFATQFHPEKSQEYGLRILENFLKWTP